MSHDHDHDHDDAHGHDAGHAHGGESETHGHLPGPVRSALGLLADGLDKARNLAGPAGEKARFVTDKVREESADVFDKVRDEGTQVVNKLRGHSAASDAGSATGHGTDDRQQRAAEALEVAKTVGAALLVGTVKVVQLAMREWQAHTGNASTPEDNVPKAAWDTAGTPKAPARPTPEDETEPQPVPEINNWDDVEAETADDPWRDATDADEPAGGAQPGEPLGGTASGDPLAGVPLADPSDDGHVEVTESLAYTSESDGAADATTIADATDSPADVDTSGAALRTEAAPAHSGSGHDAPDHSHTDPPLDGFDEMTIGSLRGRLGSLSADELAALRDYEREHSARPQVLTMLENRIAKVAAHGGDA